MNLGNSEECELLGDSKYRAYISQVEKALKNFEYTSEWADLIAALGKLNKVLGNHKKYPVIPKRVTIGKRLAQCLHPALPTGVHLKALETYDIIFKCIGTQRLATHLFTYSAGLFPLMAFAAMNVKPVLLQLYETHFVPLGVHIKPALTGLLMGILPGLEEGAEYFDRTARVLEEFRDAVDPTFFYGCLWECVLAGPGIRLAAFNFVLAHYNKKQSIEDQLYFIGTNIDLLVEALSAGVEDSSILVQRSTLDLLLLGFPIHSSPLTRPDMVKVVSAAIKVVLRRDMSLNRRLYAWLLGTDMSGNCLLVAPTDHKPLQRQDSHSTLSSETEIDYFNVYSRDFVTLAVKKSIEETTEMENSIIDGKPTNLRPFKILISLLDKPEVGSVIIEDVLVEIFRCMYRECMALGADDHRDGADGTQQRMGVPSRNGRRRDPRQKLQERALNSEVIKTANLLFGTFETYFIWDFLARLFEKSCSSASKVRKGKIGMGEPCVTELCILIDFLMDKVSLETFMENQTEHLPRLLHRITVSLYTHCSQLNDPELTLSLKLCGKILTRVLPSTIPVLEESVPSVKSQIKEHGMSRTNSEADDPAQSGSEVYVSAEGEGSDSEDREVLKEDAGAGEDSKELADTSTDTITGADSDATEFSEFVQYDDSTGTPEQWFSPKRSPGRKLQQPLTLMQACSHSFQKLFCVLISTKIIREASVVDALLEQLTLLPDVVCHSDDRMVSGLQRLRLDHISEDLCEAFGSACQLLVDFSSFPMYCVSNHRPLQATFGKGQDVKFPDWLKFLITCACFISHFTIESAAISTLLDLVSLTKTVMEQDQVKGCGREVAVKEGDIEEGQVMVEDEEEVQARERRISEGRVSVVIIPALSPAHLNYLQEQTGLFKLVARSLWQYLGEATPLSHQRSVDLLLQLHQLAPSPWVCEDVIGNALLSDNKSLGIAGHKRFAVLWHLLRDKQQKAMCGRTFDRSLFLMLDSLQNDTHPCRALTQTWLAHTVQRNDVGRILEPVLFILLHPDTARISIQHVNIQQPRKVRISSESEDSTADSTETKIYAISSEGGNVIYHVSNSSARNILQRNLEEQCTYALTSVSEAGSSTKAARAKLETEMHFEKVNAAELNLRVNPFGTDADNDHRSVFEGLNLPALQQAQLSKARRLDVATCKKEGIFFDDEQTESTVESNRTSVAESESDELLPSEIVESILEDVISDIVSTEDSDDDEQPILQDLAGNGDNRTGSMVDLRVQTGLQSNLSKMNRSMPDLSGKGRLAGLQFKDTLNLGPDDLLNAIESKMTEIDSQSETDGDQLNSPKDNKVAGVHPLHTHILLYTQKYDAQRTLYALTCLKAVLNTSPRLVACSLATTNISNTHTPQYAQLQNLLVRHRRSVFGKNFFHEVPNDAAGTYRSCMYVEILISMCLYFMRSYYPNLMMSKLTEMELNGNKEVQILSCEILTILLSELASVTKDSGKGFASYISDLLNKCKVQKSLLHCVLASVYNARRKLAGEDVASHVTEAIISFNEENMDANTNETFQLKLLKLLLVSIMLEEQIRKSKAESDLGTLPPEWDQSYLSSQPSLASVKYIPSQPVIYQRMFLSAIMSALKQQHLCHMHRHWVAMVTSALPYMSRALSFTVTSVVQQLCRNLELLGKPYELGPLYRSGPHHPDKGPPDHVLTLLEGMTTICHYCLLDNAQQDIAIGQFFRSSSANEAVTEPTSPGQILSNLIHVLNPTTSREPSPSKEVAGAYTPVLETRRHLLSILPRILASLTVMWKGVQASHSRKHVAGKPDPCWTLGTPKQIKQAILGFVSPIALHHGINLMGAVAVVWNDRRQRASRQAKKQVVPLASEDQLLLVELVSAIKVLPIDTLILTTKQVIKQPPPTSQDSNKKRTPLEVNMLQFFYAYIQHSPAQQLLDTWPSLLSLLKEALPLTLIAPGQFLLLSLLLQVT